MPTPVLSLNAATGQITGTPDRNLHGATVRHLKFLVTDANLVTGNVSVDGQPFRRAMSIARLSQHKPAHNPGGGRVQPPAAAPAV